MTTLLLAAGCFLGFLVAYHTYGRWLARKVFRLNPQAAVPSQTHDDGVDYVPTRRGIVFGHHYTSIAGTGPIVGPAIGIIWGWLPALLWVLVGSIVMGAVHDFGSLVISLRNEGKSVSDITARYISPLARTVFFLVAFLELLIVIAIFGVVIAAVFARFPTSVIPIWMQIPIAVGVGLAVYKLKANVTLATLVGVAAMYLTVWWGSQAPLALPAEWALGGAPVATWVVVLLAYAFVASVLPVTVLLQPRDYLNAWQLMIAMGLMAAGLVGAGLTGQLDLAAPAYNAAPSGAPPMWPFLMITIACGAISGFHCLVASGTTAKQLRSESDAQMVGYGSMLLEGALAVLVIVAVGAGIGMAYQTAGGEVLTGRAAWSHHYASWAGAGGLPAKINAVVVGSANMMATLGLPQGLSEVIIGVFIASFAGTTLDTATRIQRYVIGELGSSVNAPALANKWVATTVAVVSAGALAFVASPPGKLGQGALLLWPMFGAVNQLLAALALLLVSFYLAKTRARPYYLVSLLPCVFMLIVTGWAMIVNEINFWNESPRNGPLIVINALTLILAAALVFEALRVLIARPARPAEATVPVETAERE